MRLRPRRSGGQFVDAQARAARRARPGPAGSLRAEGEAAFGVVDLDRVEAAEDVGAKQAHRAVVLSYREAEDGGRFAPQPCAK